MQILNEALLLALTNIKNHISTNFDSRTKTWIKHRLRDVHFIQSLSTSNFNSWVRLIHWAGTTVTTKAADLLPRYTSLAAPLAHVMSAVEGLVIIMHSRIGVLPATDDSLSSKSAPFLSCVVDCLKISEDNVQPLQVHFILTKLSSNPPRSSGRAATAKALQLVAAEESEEASYVTISTTGRVDMVMNDVSLLFCGNFPAHVRHSDQIAS